jgi:hypothetical protein
MRCDEPNFYSYFIVGNLTETQDEVIRICSLLRGTESAVQAVSVSPNSNHDRSIDLTELTICTVWSRECVCHGKDWQHLSQLWPLGNIALSSMGGHFQIWSHAG